MQRHGHAVVLGAGIAGLLTAAALGDTFDRVTVIERDPLPDSDPVRRGVPQGGHAHVLMPRGAQAAEALLPGLLADLTRAGAVPVEPIRDFRAIIGGRRLLAEPIGAGAVQASRPFLERHLRARVSALPGVEVIDGCDAVGLQTDRSGTRVTGVRLLDREPGSAQESLPSELVVDATGRGSRTPAWLEDLGYPRPAQERPKVDLAYASRSLRLAPGTGLEPSVMVGPVAGHARGLVLNAIEHGARVLTLTGVGPANRPPDDEQGFLEFAASVAPADVADAIRAAAPLSRTARYRYPAYQRRHYRRLRRFPDGLLVTGDALCSFNPIYAQGMTIAAVQAQELLRCLRAGRAGLARRWFPTVDREVHRAWLSGLGPDLALPEVEGRPTLALRAMNAYTTRLLAAAERDPVVARRFGRVIGLLDPPSALGRPAVLRRMLRSRRADPPAAVPGGRFIGRAGDAELGGLHRNARPSHSDGRVHQGRGSVG